MDSEWPENTNYFAEPTEAVDAAWDRLLGNVTVSISLDEAQRAWGDEYLKYRDFTQGGFTAVYVHGAGHFIKYATNMDGQPRYYSHITLPCEHSNALNLEGSILTTR